MTDGRELRDALERAQVRVRDLRAQLEASLEPIRARADLEETGLLYMASGLEPEVAKFERLVISRSAEALKRKLYANSARSLWASVRAPAALLGLGALAVVVGQAANAAGLVLPLPVVVIVVGLSAAAMAREARTVGRILSGRASGDPPASAEAGSAQETAAQGTGGPTREG